MRALYRLAAHLWAGGRLSFRVKLLLVLSACLLGALLGLAGPNGPHFFDIFLGCVFLAGLIGLLVIEFKARRPSAQRSGKPSEKIEE